MKKVLSLLAVAGVFTFASCENKTTETTETTTTTETTVEENDVPVVTADSTAVVTPDTTVGVPTR